MKAEPQSKSRRDGAGLMRRGWVLAGMLAGVGAGVWSGHAWLDQRATERLQQSLPPLPDLTGRPTALRDRLQTAHSRAQNSDTPDDAIEELGRLLHANGFPGEAAWCWRSLAARQPEVARWPCLLAATAEARGDYAAMEESLLATVALDADYSPAWLRLAEYAFKTGRGDEATAAYRRRLALEPGDPYARLGLARLDLQAGREIAAREQLETLVRDHPDFGTAHNLLARILAASGQETAARRHRWAGRNSSRFAEAADPWRDDLSRDCLTPDLLFMLGTVEFQLSRGDRGRAYFERAVSLAPEVAAHHALLGDLYLKLGDAAAAQRSLTRALEIAPEESRAMSTSLNLAEAQRRLDRPDLALVTLDQAESRFGASFELWNSRGVIFTQMNRGAEARAAYEAALRLNPQDADANFNLGIQLLNDREIAAAETHFRQALTLQPTYLPALTMLVRVPLSEGRLANAKPALDTLFDAYSGVPQVRQLAQSWYDTAIATAQRDGRTQHAQALVAEAAERLRN